jgi:hypothetical protein
MKYYTGSLITMFCLQLLITAFILIRPSHLNAVESESVNRQVSQLTVEMATPAGTIDDQIRSKSDYLLPYPGILQNHPLYFLKEIRDTMIETLIVDPLRKSEFFLLQSDKWIASVPLLVNQKEIGLAGRVVNQAADRMRLAVQQLIQMNKNGKEISNGAIVKLQNAIEKHLEIVDELSAEGSINPNQARDVYLSIQKELISLKSE